MELFQLKNPFQNHDFFCFGNSNNPVQLSSRYRHNAPITSIRTEGLLSS